VKCSFSPRAVRDLEEIGDYIARDNPLRAVTFIQEIRDCCARIVENPQAAPLRSELGEGIRMAVFERYLIFYRQMDDALLIVRILHGARDIQELFLK